MEETNNDNKICPTYLNLIQAVSDYIDRKESDIIVTNELISLAQSHQIAPILYFQTRNKALYKSYIESIYVYSQRTALLNQINQILSGIPFYTVKGLAIAQYYPSPQLRTMGDCDIIVHEEDKEKAMQQLLSIGFMNMTDIYDDKEWHLMKGGLDFELHHQLIYDTTNNSEQEKLFTSTAWEHVNNNDLDASYHFVFLIIHLKKHFLYKGVGIRQFLDLVMMSKKAGIDTKKISFFLKQAGIEQFAGVCSALCLRWFGCGLPVWTAEISDDFYIRATNTIIGNGVFGFDAPVDEGKKFIDSLRNKNTIGAIADYFFPSYKTCCGIQKYKFIKKKPYLLPGLWIYRIVWALFSPKVKFNSAYVSSVATSNKAVKERNLELAEWGI